MHKRKRLLVDSPALFSLKLCISFRLFLPFFRPFSVFFHPFPPFNSSLPFVILLYPYPHSFYSFLPFPLFWCLIPLFTISQSFISYSFILIKPSYVFISLYPFYLLSLLYLLLFLFMCSRRSDLIF